MRYRTLTEAGDYSFGQGSSQWLVNTPETVAQAVLTRLRLVRGEWFLDTSEGTPYLTQILGEHTKGLYDQAIKTRILNTPGVVSIVEYVSLMDAARNLAVSCTINTLYGQTTISQVL